jgi:hypothetical protein
MQNQQWNKKILLMHCVPLARHVRSKCVACVPSPLLTATNYDVQDSFYHLQVRNSTRFSQGRENDYEEKGPVSK